MDLKGDVVSAPEYPIRLHRSALRAVSTFALLVAASPCWADPATTSAQGVEELPPVTVTAPATSAKADGSAAAGYRTEEADLGPLGDKKILDTPYSIVSVPRELMDAQQATQINDVVKYDPSAQIEPRGNLDFGRPQTRGFENASTQNTRIDGLNSYTIMSYPMEAFQSLEILNGPQARSMAPRLQAEFSTSSRNGRLTRRSQRRRWATTPTACSPNMSRPAAVSPTAPSATASTR